MTGDRRLTQEEKATFITHVFNGLETVVNSGGEPSLFEVAIIELAASNDAKTQLLIEQGRQIRVIQERLDTLEKGAS